MMLLCSGADSPALWIEEYGGAGEAGPAPALPALQGRRFLRAAPSLQ
jgi:hypothetical protein